MFNELMIAIKNNSFSAKRLNNRGIAKLIIYKTIIQTLCFFGIIRTLKLLGELFFVSFEYCELKNFVRKNRQ